MSLVTRVDFVGIPTRDLDRAVEFYGTTLGIPMSRHMPERNFAEFETGNLTLNLMNAEKMGLEHHVQRNAIALHVDDVAAARERVGGGVLVAPEVAVVVEPDAETARRIARDYAQSYLRMSNYTSNLLRHGFTEDDIRDGGSDRLIDAVIPHGTPQQIAEAVREHLDAGADHVCLQPLGHGPAPVDDYRGLAEVLLRT